MVKEDKQVHADAIVLLMGSISDRVLQVVDLYYQGLACKVILVETSHPENINAIEERGGIFRSSALQSRTSLVSLGIPYDSILILQGGATSTQMESLIIREYLSTAPEIDTLLMVSSSEHTRRASMIFNSAFKSSEKPLTVYCSPSSYTKFNPEKWWRSKEDVQAVLMEYIKIANFLLFDRRKLMLKNV